MKHEDKVRLVSTPVTLDGKPAAICGTKSSFACVATLPTGPTYEWSWETAAEIVAQGGDFRS